MQANHHSRCRLTRPINEPQTYLVVFSKMADIDFYQDDPEDNVDDGCGFDDGLSEIDENLAPLQRLQKYTDSDNVFNRQIVARTMLDTIRAVGDDHQACLAVLESMVHLSMDAEPSVRSELMEQVPHIAVYCQENRTLFPDAVPAYILPMVVRYLNDENNQVRKTSQAALLVLLEQGLVEKEDIEKQVVNVILDLASPTSQDDYRTEAVALMSKMAPLLGRDITERLFLPRFCEMLTDPLFHVRKVCASNFGEVCNVVGVENSEEVLLPKFLYLCEDGVWGVRKACAECFMTISCACSLETRRRLLANLFVNLLSDQSRWVRMSAFQQLGPFISTFADPALTGLFVNEDGTIVMRDLQSDSEMTGTGMMESRTIFINEDDEMDIVLSEADDGAGNGFSDGHLVIPWTEDKSFEEHRVEKMTSTHCENLKTTENVNSVECVNSLDQCLAEGMSRLNVDNAQLISEDIESELLKKCELDLTGQEIVNENDKLNCDNINLCPSCEPNIPETSVISETGQAVPSAEIIFQPSVLSNTSELSTPEGRQNSEHRVHVHLDNFNTFQYWRQPLPEVDIDFDLINGAPANIHVVAKVKDEDKHKVYSTHVDVIMTSNTVAGSPLSQLPHDVGSVQRKEIELSGVKIHTASVSTVSDADEETVSNIGSTHVLGQNMGEPTLAVVDGVVQDLSSSSLSYMDDFASKIYLDDAVLAQQQDIVPQSLLENYLGMVDPSRAQTVDTDITRHCAFNLPAVAYTLGRRNWHCIRHLYETLTQAMQWKVRRTLAFSIHELAQILGEEITHRDLLPVFDGFLKDLDEVRIGVLKHLADFLRLLRTEVRQKYLIKVSDFMKTDNHRNWRFRQELAEQLVLLCELYTPADIMRYLAPLAVNLCMDKVCEVRIVSFSLVCAILRQIYMEDNERLLIFFINELIEKFAHNNKWLGRQIFCQLCYVVLEENALPSTVFATHLLPPLLALGRDPIPNVRLTVAKVLANRLLLIDARLKTGRVSLLHKPCGRLGVFTA
ncbi:hypothetical protein C0Q70_18762 [Pomacea canaliculata]|uniref:Phosphatase 2A Regulatory Subunit A helical domain-containing protein n=1 Tax=Pomacea canaliculata TaxID=400727 RepID=A0A2T7NHH6_POMCA|nr:hypothetical protein C0Q70_18762 [Pomacea canaliculata]